MPKTTKSGTQTQKNSRAKQGKKGGEVIIPSTIGAMAGAAIGGLAGLALGSETARKKLALARDKAVEATTAFLENVDTETEGIQEETNRIADRALSRKTTTKRTSKKK